ncbi:hypothetical protein TVAG_181880 [Trichomonas vaginalis G3]|uniref:Surface antigen BspA-like n=1 Tax=Trichomonas vaginalis (strain ATCC PRA-98 / G3) TaxID=412133 RepID=A2F6X0_TRIV3|nr:ribonuclease inhibitor domain-containing protein [Trichomonas vaginalis G3]EAX99331.1 hypothetical protein TVAG_181880 [Trichomonas vaginalis G3]KAI5538979.1 ribonuclease inhibitor domain-containing protein [Trichomonas vaginalis G3]|eukprot:XP_001312261.1 hypothetical protein [Trichomonas vaginalis G3]
MLVKYPQDCNKTFLPSVTSFSHVGCFAGTNITEFNCPRSIKSFGSRSFHKCPVLKVINLSQSPATLIETEMFYGCWSLETLILPPKTTTILGRILGEVNLTNLVLPPTVRTVSDSFLLSRIDVVEYCGHYNLNGYFQTESNFILVDVKYPYDIFMNTRNFNRELTKCPKERISSPAYEYMHHLLVIGRAYKRR